MAGLSLFLKRLRDERAASLALVLLLLVTALFAAAAPRLLEDAANRSLRGEVAAAASRESSIRLVQTGRIDTSGTTGLAALESRGKTLEAALAPSVEALVQARSIVAETPIWQVQAGSSGAVVTLRIQEGVESRISLVAGRLPGGVARTEPYRGTGSSADKPVPAFDAALSAEAASRMGVGVGDSFSITALTNDPRSPEHSVSVVVDIVAVYQVVDQADSYWIDDESVFHSVVYNPSTNEEYTQAALLLSPEALPALMSATEAAALPFTYTWRSYVDPGRLDGGQLDELVTAMRRLEAAFPPGVASAASTGPTRLSAGAAPPPEAALQSGLLSLLESHRAIWATAQAILIVAATGTAAVAAAMVWLIVLLTARRRRHAVVLSRRRGASFRQVLTVTMAEAVLLSVPPAVLAAWLAAVAIPAGTGLMSVAAAGSIAALGITALVATALGRGAGGHRLTDETTKAGAAEAGTDADANSDAGGPSRNRRRVLEAALVVGAIGAAYLLRERGIAAAGTAGSSGTASSAAGSAAASDPLFEAVPALVGLAAGLVAIRLYPILMRQAARLLAIRRDLVPFLAVRHAARGPGAGAVLLVLIVTATVGSFAAAVLGSLDRAVDAVAWQEVGAPYRVNSLIGPLNAGLDPAHWPEVQAVASVSQGTVPLGTGGFRLLETIEMQPYRAIVEGSPADPGIPAELLGRADEPFPAIVSVQSSGSYDQPAVGDVFTIHLGQDNVRFRTVAVRSSFPGLPAGQPFVVVSREQLAARPADLPGVTSLFIKAPDGAAALLRAALGPRTGDVAIVSRAEQAGTLRNAPVDGAVVAGIGVAAATAILCAALAVAAALYLAASARAVETSHLRSLGLTSRQAAALIVAEFGPAVLVALVGGAGLGLGLFLYLKPGLGIGAIVGSPLDTPAAVALPQLAMLFAATAVTAAIAIGLAAASQRGASPAAAIRRGID